MISETVITPGKAPGNVVNDSQWEGIDSVFRLIVVAALRSKQLLHGSRPRIASNPLKRRNTSIALEEVKQGLVPFTIIGEERRSGGDDDDEGRAI